MIADASPLIILAKAGWLRLLRNVGSPILVPATVWSECTVGSPRPEAQALLNAQSDGVIRVVADPTLQLAGRFPHLGKGERCAIALAIHEKDEILVDDQAARHAAKTEGLAAIGCLGLLLREVKSGRMKRGEGRTVLTSLLAAGLWVGPDIVAAMRDQLEG